MVNLGHISLLLNTAAGAWAAQVPNNPLAACAYAATCTVSGIEGVCVDVSAGYFFACMVSEHDTPPKRKSPNVTRRHVASVACFRIIRCCTGTATAGYCPGGSEVQCCTQATCTTPAGSGTCVPTSACAANDTSYAGYCSGPADLQCCVDGAGPSPPAPSPPSGSYNRSAALAYAEVRPW
jgi:hypothetical protein